TARHRPRSAPGWRQNARKDRARTAGYLGSFRGLPHAIRSDMTGGATLRAMIGVRADKQAPAMVIGHDFVEIGIRGTAQPARRRRIDRPERMIVEIERPYLGPGRDGIDALLPPRAEQLQRRHPVHLRIVE